MSQFADSSDSERPLRGVGDLLAGGVRNRDHVRDWFDSVRIEYAKYNQLEKVGWFLET